MLEDLRKLKFGVERPKSPRLSGVKQVYFLGLKQNKKKKKRQRGARGGSTRSTG